MESTRYSPVSDEEYIKILKWLIDAEGYAGCCSYRKTSCQQCEYSIARKESAHDLYWCKAFYITIDRLDVSEDSLNDCENALKLFKKAYDIEIRRLIESE